MSICQTKHLQQNFQQARFTIFRHVRRLWGSAPAHGAPSDSLRSCRTTDQDARDVCGVCPSAGSRSPVLYWHCLKHGQRSWSLEDGQAVQWMSELCAVTPSVVAFCQITLTLFHFIPGQVTCMHRLLPMLLVLMKHMKNGRKTGVACLSLDPKTVACQPVNLPYGYEALLKAVV